MKKQIDAWTLWDSMFKEGDNIILITDDDEFKWGKIKRATEGSLDLKTGQRPVEVIDWDDIRFMAHDGFPVKKLMGADGSQLIEQLDTTNTQKTIRQALEAKRCPRCRKFVLVDSLRPVKYKAYSRWSRTRKPRWDREHIECKKCRSRKGNPDGDIFERNPFTLVVGDPFLIENVDAILMNAGNLWKPGFESWMYEETFVLQAKDGAQGLLWGLPTCYYFGK